MKSVNLHVVPCAELRIDASIKVACSSSGIRLELVVIARLFDTVTDCCEYCTLQGGDRPENKHHN